MKRGGLAGLPALFVLGAMALPQAADAATVTLYSQNFENPNAPGFVNGSTVTNGYNDVSQQKVNTLYGGQPAGFSFSQVYTVETVLLTGDLAFGTGYNDPTGIGGNYALGMLSTLQDDRLGLAFDVGAHDFLNFRLDVSALGLDRQGAHYGSSTEAPVFRFTLYDNPTGAAGVGSGLVLDTADLVGVASALDTLNWTAGSFAFDASGSTNGNVILQIDLLSGKYAVMDNFLITTSDTALGGISSVPTPASALLLTTALGGLGFAARRRRARMT